MEMTKMVEIQWACVAMAAICSAAGLHGFSDEVSGFDDDKLRIEWEVSLDKVVDD